MRACGVGAAADTARRGMPIKQVSHFNHVDDEQDANAPPLEPSGPLAALGTAEERLRVKKFFVRNPKLLKEQAIKFKRSIESGRNNIDTTARFKQAEMWKTGANVLFSNGKPHAALIGYLVGIWYLRQGRPACPMAIAYTVASAKDAEAEFTTSGLGDIAAWLDVPTATVEVGKEVQAGDSSQAEAAEDAKEAPGVDASESDATASAEASLLRISLHLNAAAAALKLSEWPAARAACEVVLAVDALNNKALFRLAKAHEGGGDLKAALTAVVALIKRDPQNRDARSLHEELKKRQAEEKDKFKNLFGAKEGAAAGGAPAAAPAAAPSSFEEAYEAHVRERQQAGESSRVYDDEDEKQREELAADASAPAAAASTEQGDAPKSVELS